MADGGIVEVDTGAQLFDPNDILNGVTNNDAIGVVDQSLLDTELNPAGLGEPQTVQVPADNIVENTIDVANTPAVGAGADAASGIASGAAAGAGVEVAEEATTQTLGQQISNWFSNAKDSVNNELTEGSVLGKNSQVGGWLSERFKDASNGLSNNQANQNVFSNLFSTMSDYPILGAAGLATASFFLVKLIKKIWKKIRGKDEPELATYSR